MRGCIEVLINPIAGHTLAALLGYGGALKRIASRQNDLLFSRVLACDFHDGREFAAWYAPDSGDGHVAVFISPFHWKLSRC